MTFLDEDSDSNSKENNSEEFAEPDLLSTSDQSKNSSQFGKILELNVLSEEFKPTNIPLPVEYSIKKPKRIFQSKEHLCQYIDGFRTKYKTEMCKNWELTGDCIFGDSCSFAHGSQELVSKVNMPKNYKTRPCKRFHEDLYCPYGPRCQFKHKDEGNPKAN